MAMDATQCRIRHLQILRLQCPACLYWAHNAVLHRILTYVYIIFNFHNISIYKHSPNLRLRCSACLYWAHIAVLHRAPYSYLHISI